MRVIDNRRSIRKYKDTPIDKATVDKLLRAAMQAPSAGNQQPWEFIVVEDKERLSKLSEISIYAKMVAEAPLAFVLVGNRDRMKYQEYWQQDLSAAAQNILLEAVELGLGAVWLGVAPMEDRCDYIKGMFDLDDNLRPFCIIVVGHPDGGQENKFVNRFDESRIHYEGI